MLKKKVEDALNEQIKLEEESSRIYMAMASWCERNGFPGASKFLYKHSDEERLHQIKIIHYVNERGGKALLKQLADPGNDYKSLKSLLEQVLQHEVHVTESINALYHLATQEKDYTTGQFLQWFIMEQIEEESLVGGILDKMNLLGSDKGGIFHIDKELEALGAPDAAKA
ncbi:MAG TPA: ferritin [Bacteroidales bacterium]|nr:ferritin [Bacteroidales bacterium]HNS46328.1 ferritin [Bacteroidales bacterium]